MMTSWADFALRLLLAFILGAAIGIERQWQKTRAVLKTNVLVCLGAAMFVMMSTMVPGDSSPTRVAAQVVSGVGFLGGGVILREGASVRGLNTAATLWCAAAVGSFVGAGLLLQAYFGTLAVVGANLLLRPLGEWFQKLDEQLLTHTKPETRYCCRVVCHAEDEATVRALLLDQVQERALILTALSSKTISVQDIDNLAQVEIKADFIAEGRNNALLEQVVTLLKLKVRVSAIRWDFISEDGE
jgi:putative Mg2+ transporter-C (MgtC) family protein